MTRAAWLGAALCGCVHFASTTAHADTPSTPVAVQEHQLASQNAPAVAFDSKWRGGWFGGFLLPEQLDVGADGGVDVVVHFNGAMMADRDYRESKTNAIVVSIAINEVVGSSGYAKLFESPTQLDRVLEGLFAEVKKIRGEQLSLRRLGVVSWSAGIGAVSRLLKSKWGERIDSLVLLDSLHARYLDKQGKPWPLNAANAVMGLGDDAVDPASLVAYLSFARQAAEGKKTMVVSASAVRPPNYASCSEAARVLFRQLTGGLTVDDDDREAPRKMQLRFHGGRGNFHVFGWKGGGKTDHIDQLHLVGDLLREHVGHRWHAMSRREKRERI